MSLAPGTRLGPYEILGPIGAGGMGEVYRARDERLGRQVAVKVLPGDVGGDAERLKRFEQEARAAGALDHPNVLTVHDFGAHEGTTFLVTELLEGETLRERLRAGPVPWRKALEWGRQIAAGLASAHEKGIVHRDLKPENLFVTTDGRVKILDFGLAKVRGGEVSATDSTLARTEPGTVMGTAGYMSPEQVRGLPADARSDIFAFGAVLYEMLAGRRAFDGDSYVERGHAVLTTEMPDLSASGVAVPQTVERVMRRCLEKAPDQRFQSARDLAFALEALSGITPEYPSSGRLGSEGPSDARSIAVLPFANLSSDPEQEYFCDGMTEEIITALSKIRGLRVISRNSVMRLKGTHKTTRDIGELLKVGHVLEGSVRKAGNNLRIAAQLIDAASDGHLWAEHYAGTLDDVFEIQEKVARAITDALQVKLSPTEQLRLAERPASDPQVLDCYHRAWHEMIFATKQSFERSIRILEHGINNLGEHPLLYVGLAQAHYYAVEFFLGPREESLRKAAEFTRRVEEADSRFAHALLAKYERCTGSQVRAIRHFEDAVIANPGDVDSLLYLGWCYGFHAGNAAAAASVGDRLISIDPLTEANLLPRLGSFWADADFPQALAVLEDMRRPEPGLRWLNLNRMQVLAVLGRIADACRVAEETVAENAHDNWARLVTAFKHALLGERESLLALMTGEFESSCWNDPDIAVWLAGWFAFVNETDRAFRWLEHWIDRGSINYPMLSHGDPMLERLRGNPRFQRLLDRVRPEWERFVPRFQLGI